MTQDNFDATLWRRFGTSRLARTLCAAPTGAANMALYGKMPSVVYEDYPEAQLIILWGVNPSTSGIHLVPFVRDAQKRGAKLIVIDPRSTQMARAADVHLPIRPGTDVAVALAIHNYLFASGLADEEFLGAQRVQNGQQIFNARVIDLCGTVRELPLRWRLYRRRRSLRGRLSGRGLRGGR